MEKETLYEYIIYKIFTSKYKDLFVLDGSYGLYLTVDSEYKRKPGDLDLDEIVIKGSEEKEVNWEEIIDIFKDIFKDKSISLSYAHRGNKTREFNKNSIGAKIIANMFDIELEFDLSLIFNRDGEISTKWVVKNKDLIYNFKIKENEEIKINKFEAEKYFANKILAIMKHTKNLTSYDWDISKSLYDIWFILKTNSHLDNVKLSNQFKLMYNDFDDLNTIFTKLLPYIEKCKYNQKVDSRLSSFIIKNIGDNGLVMGAYEILTTISVYLKSMIKESN